MGTITTSLQRKLLTAALSIGGVTALPSGALADNPIVQTVYTPDPAPMVYDDTVYLYTGHDEDSATDWFGMNEWRVYSSKDMVNWTDHGSPLKYSDFSWAKGDAWAGQAIHRNGKFYYYVPVTSRSLNRMTELIPGCRVGGHVRLLSAATEAARLAYRIPGVVEVIDKITFDVDDRGDPAVGIGYASA